MRILFFLLSFVLFSAQKCENQPGSYGPDTYVEMKKSGCFGTCPIYTIRIDGSGKASYKGDRFVVKTGNYTKQFTEKQTEGLMQAFENVDFWSFEDEYLADITDLPYTFLTFSQGGKTKKITLYYHVPDQLTALANLVSSFADSEGGWEATEQK